MKAIVVRNDRLVWDEVDAPALNAGEVLIKVAATALNRADLMQKAGFYPPPPGASDILGLECSGTVVDVGDGQSEWQAGDPVCALLAGGGYAEYAAVPAGQLLPVPKGISVVDAAALPEVFATAFLNVYQEAACQPGERVLLHAGASGVGTAAIQLCKALGNPCFVTAGSAEKIQRCIELGAETGWNRHSGEDFAAQVNEWSQGRGADVILDPVGGEYLSLNQACLALDGRLVLIGLMGGASSELNLATMLMKRQRLMGSTLRSRSLAQKAALIAALRDQVWPRFDDRTLVPIIEAIIPVEDADKAFELIQSNDSVGKVLLSV